MIGFVIIYNMSYTSQLKLTQRKAGRKLRRMKDRREVEIETQVLKREGLPLSSFNINETFI